MRKWLFLFVGVAASTAFPALAEQDRTSPSQGYLGLLVGRLYADDATNPTPDDGSSHEVLYGYQSGSGFGLEGLFSSDIIKPNGGAGYNTGRNALGLDGLYAFGDRTHFTPFLLAGGGYTRSKRDENSSSSGIVTGPNNTVTRVREEGPYANGGIGFITGSEGWLPISLRGEIRYVRQSGLNDYRASVGLEIPLFQSAAFSAPVAAAPEPLRVAPVEVAPAPVAEPPVATVTADIDSDGDGITDRTDECPNTPTGTRVDHRGCALREVIVLKGVNFESSSDRLRPDSEAVLQLMAETLKRYPDMKVEVAGHTDSTAADDYNQQLSERRAQSVRDYLIEAGVAAGNLTARGYGKTQPIDTNDTLPGRERNRRVELHILDDSPVAAASGNVTR